MKINLHRNAWVAQLINHPTLFFPQRLYLFIFERQGEKEHELGGRVGQREK